MGNKQISFKDKDGNFVSAADVWNPKKLYKCIRIFRMH